MKAVFVRQLEAELAASLGGRSPLHALVVDVQLLITALGLVSLSSWLTTARGPASEANPVSHLLERLAVGHGEMLHVLAARVVAAALLVAVAPAQLAVAHRNVLERAQVDGPRAGDPRAELHHLLRELAPRVAGDDRGEEVRRLCASLALTVAQIGVHGSMGAGRAAPPTTRPAPPAPPAGDEGECDA